MEHPFLSIIIPAYNEEKRIGITLNSAMSYLIKQDFSWEILVVDDGSIDSTVSEVKKIREKMKSHVRLLSVSHGGKGWAVKNGMLAALGTYRFMADADLSMPINQLDRFLIQMELGKDIVIGSRQIAGARRFNEPSIRHIVGKCFNWFVRLVALKGIQDTQCGFKCFTCDAAEYLFSVAQTKGFGFDVEILSLARRRGFKIVEIPIDWYHERDTKIRLFVDSFVMFWETIKVSIRGLMEKYVS